MSGRNMQAQYDRWTRAHVRHRNRQRRFDRIFKQGDEPDAINRKDLHMTRDETLRSMVKRHDGVVGLCKYIDATGTATVSEHELVALATDEAKREHPGLSDAQAFTKAFTGPSGEPLRQAIETIKLAQPGIDGGRAERAAYRLLEKLADDERRRSPNLSSAQAFARVFRDHPQLAELAHRRPRPTTSYPWPV